MADGEARGRERDFKVAQQEKSANAEGAQSSVLRQALEDLARPELRFGTILTGASLTILLSGVAMLIAVLSVSLILTVWRVCCGRGRSCALPAIIPF